MASNYQIFLRDEQVIGPNATNKRTISELHTILETIIPSDIVIQKIIPAGGGFFISHANDLDLNYIFKAEIIDKLKDNHFKTELAHRIQDLRKIVIPDIPTSIFNRSEVDLIAEINDKNDINILTLTKFDREEKNKKYFFITLDSITARNLTINKGKIIISDNHLSAYKPFSKSKNTPSGNLLPQQSYFTPSAQNRGFALASSSRWGGPQQQNQNHQTNTNVPPPGFTYRQQGPQTHQHSLQTKSSAHQGHSECDLLFNALIINQICKTLSCGIENPETYLALQNKALSQRGLPPFVIPKSELLESKKLYYAKIAINPSLTQSPTSLPVSAPKNPPSTNLPTNLSQLIPQPQSAELTIPQSEDLPPLTKSPLSPQPQEPPSITNPPPSPKPHSAHRSQDLMNIVLQDISTSIFNRTEVDLISFSLHHKTLPKPRQPLIPI